VSDIFISYASADRDRARAIAQALTEQGWSVWWDRTIPPGRQWDEVIEEALDLARCVVVLWSKASVASQWVKTEAAEAMRRKILVPVLIEDVKIPLEFRRLQAADLSTWTGGSTHEEVQKFFASIGTNVGQPAAPPEPGRELPGAGPPPGATPRPARPPEIAVPAASPVPPPAEPPRSKSKALLLAAAALASIVVIAVGYTAYNERVKRQAMEERAERERRAAEEARRAAEDAAARAKLAQEAAAREAAQRRAEQERRAAEDARRAADAAAAARASKAAQEEAARAKSAQEAAVRAKAAQEEAARQQAAAKQGATSMRINWYDHALRFSGTLSGKPSSASLQATVYDIKTGAQIGNYDVPAIVTKEGTGFIVTGTFQVPKDSVTPYPHAHTSRLLLRRQSDGSLHYVENCPQVGKQCYR